MKRIKALVLLVFFICFYAFAVSNVETDPVLSEVNAEVVLKGSTAFFDVSKSDPDYIYAVVSGYVWKTENGGENWEKIKSISTIVNVEIDGKDPDIVYAAQGS
ncbi:WD40/YVTN/BNR-like repeat-containing protein [candidate division KSB1 bacterium]